MENRTRVDVLRKRMRRELRADYERQRDQLEAKIDAYKIATYISKKWNKTEGRKSTYDTVFPIYLSLALNKEDELCTDCMLFLEQMEDELNVDFHDSEQLMSTEAEYGIKTFGTRHLFLTFIAHAEGTCQIIETEKIEKVEKEVKTKSRQIIC